MKIPSTGNFYTRDLEKFPMDKQEEIGHHMTLSFLFCGKTYQIKDQTFQEDKSNTHKTIQVLWGIAFFLLAPITVPITIVGLIITLCSPSHQKCVKAHRAFLNFKPEKENKPKEENNLPPPPPPPPPASPKKETAVEAPPKAEEAPKKEALEPKPHPQPRLFETDPAKLKACNIVATAFLKVYAQKMAQEKVKQLPSRIRSFLKRDELKLLEGVYLKSVTAKEFFLREKQRLDQRERLRLAIENPPRVQQVNRPHDYDISRLKLMFEKLKNRV